MAVTGRRLGRTDRWPYSRAAALPRAYLDAVTRAGGQPMIVDDAPDPKALLARVDALVLTGGPDVDPALYQQVPHASVYGVDRRADEFEAALADVALARGIPTLAICRGTQILNVARGGTLFQHIPDVPGVVAHGQPGEAGGARLHDVRVEPESLLAEVLATTTVAASCHHHQAVDTLGDGLHVTARAGDGIVEGLELDGAFTLAVQWHPEDTAATDRVQQRLFDALVDTADA
ncbi:MAG: gamma-glutamyl-gamma-aminobutyrate hydrolase family protein [Actinomycetota bacterium]